MSVCLMLFRPNTLTTLLYLSFIFLFFHTKVSIESQTTALDEDDESSKDSLMDELAEVKSKVSFYK